MSSLSMHAFRRRHRVARIGFFATIAVAGVMANFVPYESARHDVTGFWIWQLPQLRSPPLADR